MNPIVYWKETKYEFLKLLRLRRYVISVVAFPLMFYVFFGLAFASKGGAALSMATYLIATYGCFGVMGACLFGVGANLANERGLGWLEMKRVSPLPASAYFAAKLAASMAFSFLIVILLLSMGVAFGHVRISFVDALQVVGVLLMGAIPFGALGIALGYSLNASSAPAFLNMVNLPMAFCSGLWIPVQFLPSFLQKAAPFLPAYHLSGLALGVFGLDATHAYGQHWEALAAFTLVFLGWAHMAFRREESGRGA